MGMAASQATLLSITARMHDVELKAQNIMNQKIALATQKDELYSEYTAALDATKIQIAYNTGDKGGTKFVDATFANLCGYNPQRSGTYALTDMYSGFLLVEDDVYNAYNNFSGSDKYAFALEMSGIDPKKLSFDSTNMGDIGVHAGFCDEEGNGKGTGECGSDYSAFYTYCGHYKDPKTGTWTGYVVMSDTEGAVYEKHKDDNNKALSNLYSKVETAASKCDEKELQTAIDNLRSALYEKYAGEIYEGILNAKDDDGNIDSAGNVDFDSDDLQKFNYYLELFEGIQAAGGCIPVSKYSEDGDTGTEWLTNMIKSGRIMLNEYSNKKTNKGWNEVSIATSLNVQETNDDTNEKKAEAKYQHELDIINRKDTRYDQDLNKLETERTALKTEMDSIKQVKDDNIERTFKIFS